MGTKKKLKSNRNSEVGIGMTHIKHQTSNIKHRTPNIILLLGTNLGNRKKNISTAIKLLKELGAVKNISSLYETAAWGNTHQPAFINCAIIIQTPLPASQLLKNILTIEKKMGRIRTSKWCERLIDIDILFFGEDVVDTKNLIIPHPQFENRKFAIIPVKEIAPRLIHPVTKKTITQIADVCADKLTVKIVSK